MVNGVFTENIVKKGRSDLRTNPSIYRKSRVQSSQRKLDIDKKSTGNGDYRT